MTSSTGFLSACPESSANLFSSTPVSFSSLLCVSVETSRMSDFISRIASRTSDFDMIPRTVSKTAMSVNITVVNHLCPSRWFLRTSFTEISSAIKRRSTSFSARLSSSIWLWLFGAGSVFFCLSGINLLYPCAPSRSMLRSTVSLCRHLTGYRFSGLTGSNKTNGILFQLGSSQSM